MTMAEYIDCEALLHDIEQSVVYTARGKITSAEMRGAHKIIERIKCAPAVDVAPVVHGRKIEDGDIGCFWLCSLCGECLPYGANYCPNCGAKMDGGESNAKSV